MTAWLVTNDSSDPGSRLARPVAGSWQGLKKDVSPLKSCGLLRRREAIFQAGEAGQRLGVPGEMLTAKALLFSQRDVAGDAIYGVLVFW
jgi:hypothetical protein